MLTTIPTITVSALYLLWEACRRTRRPHRTSLLGPVVPEEMVGAQQPPLLGDATDSELELRLAFYASLANCTPPEHGWRLDSEEK